ncbi:MAG: DNA topoisomerase IV subunit A [Candidatus Helarchaeota archaeon]
MSKKSSRRTTRKSSSSKTVSVKKSSSTTKKTVSTGPKEENIEISKETLEVINNIKRHAKMILEGFIKGNPVIEIPIRGKTNIQFNEENGFIEVLDKSKVSERAFNNIAHSRKFMQYVLVLNFCKRLLETNSTSDLRDLYYSLKRGIPGTREKTFNTQDESNPIIEDIEISMETWREQLHISADPKGYIVGDIVFEQILKNRVYEIDCNNMGTGWGIPSNVEPDILRIKSINAKYLLAIESAGMYNRLVEEAFHEKNKCILVALKGQASRGTRRLIHRIAYEKDIPVYTFVDGDPWGYYIYSVLKFGSMSLSYISNKLATPKAKFIGMTMTDIKEYELEESTHPLNKIDIKRIDDLLELPWFQKEEWQRELKLMKKMEKRIEQQALASKALDFVATTYLPEKIKNKKFLP